MPTKIAKSSAATTHKISAAPSRNNVVRSTSPASQNGKLSPNDHLVKANKAMERAWKLISERKGDGD